MSVKTPTLPRIKSSHKRESGKPPIEWKAYDLLRHSPYRSLQHVDCRFENGRLTLRGRVESYFLKQVAQERLLKNLSSSIQILNLLDVER